MASSSGNSESPMSRASSPRCRSPKSRKGSPLSKRTSRSASTATTIMEIVHDALRRDLVRLRSALGSAPPPDGDRRVAIADHARWMMDYLHHHHQAEETGLWPLIRQRTPWAQGLLDRMEADYAHVTPAAERLRQTAARECARRWEPSVPVGP